TIVDGTKFKEYKFTKGERITIQVINTHPALYKYEFVNTETEIEDPEFPDFSPLVSVLSGELGLQIETAEKERKAKLGPTNEQNDTWQGLYYKEIEKFKSW